MRRLQPRSFLSKSALAMSVLRREALARRLVELPGRRQRALELVAKERAPRLFVEHARDRARVISCAKQARLHAADVVDRRKAFVRRPLIAVLGLTHRHE